MPAGGVPKDLRGFLAGRDGVEAVLQRTGHRTYDVVFVDGRGEWTHWVVESPEAARALADAASVTLHEGWSEELARRTSEHDPWADPQGQRRAR
jgi:hypothetical protein